MMSKRLAADRQDNLIRINLGRGCYLLLTWAEYVAGIERGKRDRRLARFEGANEYPLPDYDGEVIR